MSKLAQQLQVVQSSKSQIQPIRCDFCGSDHPNGHCSYQNNSSEAKVNYMSNQGRQDDFYNNNNYQNNMSQGWKRNQNKGLGWKQDVGLSNRKASFQQQQPLYPPVKERLSKFKNTLEKFMKASLANQRIMKRQ